MKKFLMVLSACLLSCPVLIGQTVNTGELYVSPGTEFSTLGDFENTETGSLYNDGVGYFYAHFYNDGLVDHYQDSGVNRFVGFLPQTIGGQGTTYFWGITFKNEAAETPFFLEADITAEGEVDFIDGIIDNRNYGGNFIFGEMAGYTEVSNNSHVDGPVRKTGDADFEYPIGNKGYFRMAGISGVKTINQTYKATYFFENADQQYPLLSRPDIIQKINDAEYWKIEPTDINTGMVVTLSWNEATTPDFLLQNPEALHIVRWDEQQQLWVDEGGAVDERGSSVSAAVSSFGIFTLATVETGEVLPCQLAVYNAITPNNDGHNDYFLIDQLNNGGCAENISVKIFNRWNVKVFETENYGKAGNVFDGYSDGRATMGSEQLPTGTYFYILEFKYATGEGKEKTYQQQGYLYLNGN